MIVTPIKVLRLPEPYAKMTKYKRALSESFFPVLDFASLLQGEIVAPNYYNPFPSSLAGMNGKLDACQVSIVTNQGSLDAYRVSLCRRFHFFDDFFSTFPNETTVTLPFDEEVVSLALKTSINVDTDALVKCYECLAYLNPKTTLHYFLYNTRGMNKDVLAFLTEQFTDEERTSLLERARLREPINKRPPLPREGTGVAVIAPLLERSFDYDNLCELFSDCPSFLFYAFYDGDDKRREDVMCTADFSKEVAYLDYSSTCVITAMIARILTTTDSWEVARKCLIMLRITSPDLNDIGEVIPLPYNVEPKIDSLSSTLGHNIMNDIQDNVARLYSNKDK